MALSAAVTQFTHRTTNGTLAVTPGFPLKAGLLVTFVVLEGNTVQDGWRPNLGVLSGPFPAGASIAGLASTTAARRLNVPNVIGLTNTDGSAASAARARVVSATALSLQWTQAANTNLAALFGLGGADVTASQVVIWPMPSATGSHVVRGFGFKPDLVLHLVVGPLTADLPSGTTILHNTLGAMTADDQWVVANVVAAGTAPQNAFRRQSTAGTLGFLSTTDGAWTALASRTSLDDGGFTLNFSATSSGAWVISLGIKGPQFKVGAFNKTTTTPDPDPVVQDVALPFTPKAALLASFQAPTNAAALDDARLGLGMFDGAGGFAAAGFAIHAANPHVRRSQTQITKAFIKTIGTDDTISAQCTAAPATEKMTLTWDVNDAVADEILFVAAGDAAENGGDPDPPAEPAVTYRPRTRTVRQSL